MKDVPAKHYFPAILCAEYDSPIDALIGLCVPQDEAMNLVAASWRNGEAPCIVTTVDGGRSVAVLRTPEGRWAACNTFLDACCSTRSEAERELQKRLKRGRRGCVGHALDFNSNAIPRCWPIQLLGYPTHIVDSHYL